MGRQSSEKKRRREGLSAAKVKGNLVEQIVAGMHKKPGVSVESNVFLPVVGEDDRREIDVLLTAEIAGYPIRFAISCKNEGKTIGAPKIDEFVGTLDDVGIPTQCGIYVSASGYTSGAIRRAKKAGIRTLRGSFKTCGNGADAGMRSGVSFQRLHHP